MRAIRHGAGALIVVMVWSAVAAGRFAQPDYIPAERLIENATAYIQAEPNDPSGYYTLGRIHYLAFVNKAFLVATFDERRVSSLIPYWWWENYLRGARRAEATRIALAEFGLDSTAELTNENRSAFYARRRAIEDTLEAENWQPEPPTTEQLVEHAGAAQWNFYQAIARDPNNALYYLGQASLAEQYFEFLQETSPATIPSALAGVILDGVRQTYRLAYELSIAGDLERESLPLPGLHGIISYEAGSAYVRLWEAQGEVPPAVQEELMGIKANLATLEALPRGAITPIVFSLEANWSLAELLADGHVVSFDLDGDGVIERRPWVKPTTGFLVWDGNGDGRITSGREMFGSVTWWLFFSNGYRAMDVLDDNRNGWLESGELEGISVWFDRNSNGRSDPGEVVAVERLPIVAIATRSTGRDGSSPMHECGLRLQDGRSVPTYDWIAPPVERGPQPLGR